MHRGLLLLLARAARAAGAQALAHARHVRRREDVREGACGRGRSSLGGRGPQRVATRASVGKKMKEHNVRTLAPLRDQGCCRRPRPGARRAPARPGDPGASPAGSPGTRAAARPTASTCSGGGRLLRRQFRTVSVAFDALLFRVFSQSRGMLGDPSPGGSPGTRAAARPTASTSSGGARCTLLLSSRTGLAFFPAQASGIRSMLGLQVRRIALKQITRPAAYRSAGGASAVLARFAAASASEETPSESWTT